MPDSKSKRGKPDRIRVSIDQRHEREYWSKHFGCSVLQLRRAVEAVGPMAADVRKQLAGLARNLKRKPKTKPKRKSHVKKP